MNELNYTSSSQPATGESKRLADAAEKANKIAAFNAGVGLFNAYQTGKLRKSVNVLGQELAVQSEVLKDIREQGDVVIEQQSQLLRQGIEHSAELKKQSSILQNQENRQQISRELTNFLFELTKEISHIESEDIPKIQKLSLLTRIKSDIEENSITHLLFEKLEEKLHFDKQFTKLNQMLDLVKKSLTQDDISRIDELENAEIRAQLLKTIKKNVEDKFQDVVSFEKFNELSIESAAEILGIQKETQGYAGFDLLLGTFGMIVAFVGTPIAIYLSWSDMPWFITVGLGIGVFFFGITIMPSATSSEQLEKKFLERVSIAKLDKVFVENSLEIHNKPRILEIIELLENNELKFENINSSSELDVLKKIDSRISALESEINELLKI